MAQWKHLVSALYISAALLGLAGCKTTEASANALTYPTASFPGGSAPLDIKAEIYKPEGAGPFPAVILVHGSAGLREHHRNWAKTVVSWGYVAIVPDSFTPRGFTNISSNGYLVLPQTRVSDVLGAAEWLRQQPYVSKDKLAVLGFSHGGWTTMVLLQSKYHAKDFGIVGTVAYYPVCDLSFSYVSLPVLVQIGDKDDWTPAEKCRQMAANPKSRSRDLIELVVYPDAYHGFDEKIAGSRPVYVEGISGGQLGARTIASNPAAGDAAEKRTREFLDKLLK